MSVHMFMHGEHDWDVPLWQLEELNNNYVLRKMKGKQGGENNANLLVPFISCLIKGTIAIGKLIDVGGLYCPSSFRPFNLLQWEHCN